MIRRRSADRPGTPACFEKMLASLVGGEAAA